MVTVLLAKDPPRMTAFKNRTILEDSGLQLVSLSGLSPGPSNESTQTLSITAASDNPSLIPAPTVNYTNPVASGSLTFRPQENTSELPSTSKVVNHNLLAKKGGIDSLTNAFM